MLVGEGGTTGGLFVSLVINNLGAVIGDGEGDGKLEDKLSLSGVEP